MGEVGRAGVSIGSRWASGSLIAWFCTDASGAGHTLISSRERASVYPSWSSGPHRLSRGGPTQAVRYPIPHTHIISLEEVISLFDYDQMAMDINMPLSSLQGYG